MAWIRLHAEEMRRLRAEETLTALTLELAGGRMRREAVQQLLSRLKRDSAGPAGPMDPQQAKAMLASMGIKVVRKGE